MSENKILTKLPMRGKHIDWESTVGMKLGLLYEDEIYKVKVIKYNCIKGRGILWIDYDGYVYDKGIEISHFKYGKFGKILKINTREFKINIGETFKDDKRDLVITDREYRIDKSGIKRKWYKYTCNVCGWTEGWIEESNLKIGKGCSCCSNRTAVLGINTIYDKAPWMMKWVSEEDAKRYAPNSHKRVEATCLDCGRKKEKKIYDIYRNKSISCTCGDSISYPEKFIISVLMQLESEFQTQLSKSTFEWIGEKRYDFYLHSLNMIIETHGLQHYEENTNFKMSLKEVQENDLYKKQMAEKNGIKNYIVIDCRRSDLEWIKNSILNSKLNEFFDLSKIDWLKCEEFALKNIVKEVCDYWNNKEEWETVVTIANDNKWGIKDRNTIRKYIKKGVELGWCHYHPREEYMKAMRRKENSAKRIKIFKGGILLEIFESCHELSRQSEELFGVKLFPGNIYDVCNGKKSQYKGFTFRYIDEGNQQIAS